VVQLATAFLSFLLDSDPLIQDIATLGVCHCYSYCNKLAEYEASLYETIGNAFVSYKDASVAVATNVISSITKERRAQQPAGFGVAGTTAGTVAQHPPTLLGPNGAVTALLNAAPASIAQAARDINRAGDGDDTAPAPTGRRGDNLNQGSVVASSHLYGVHAEVCKLAKRAGDVSTVFAFLSMVRCDPSFGLGPTADLLLRYKAQGTVLRTAKHTSTYHSLYFST